MSQKKKTYNVEHPSAPAPPKVTLTDIESDNAPKISTTNQSAVVVDFSNGGKIGKVKVADGGAVYMKF
jgi:Tol biopolymer transport system component